MSLTFNQVSEFVASMDLDTVRVDRHGDYPIHAIWEVIEKHFGPNETEAYLDHLDEDWECIWMAPLPHEEILPTAAPSDLVVWEALRKRGVHNVSVGYGDCVFTIQPMLVESYVLK